MILWTPRVVIESSIYLAGCSFALWKGGRPERIVATAMILEFVVGVSVRTSSENPHYLSLGLDIAVLAAVIYVAFTTQRRWALVGSALQILSILCYITRLLDPSILSWTYLTVGIALGYALLLALIYGTVQHVLQTRKRKSEAVHP
jgi:hypothetical protein